MLKLNSLMYHDLRETYAAGGRYSFTTAEFGEHLDAIEEAGAGSPWILGDAPETAGFALTFDDGDKSCLFAAEKLAEHGWKAFFFIITGAVGNPRRLAKADIRRLSGMGHVIGSHSADHPSLLACREDAFILDQWSRSKAALEDMLGREVSSAAVPGGSYSERVARAAEEAGLETLFTSEPVAKSWLVGRCRVLGRYALEKDMDSRTVADLAVGARTATTRRYLEWNAKQAVKRALGWATAAIPARGTP